MAPDNIGGIRSISKIQSKERMFDIDNVNRTTAQPPETYKMVKCFRISKFLNFDHPFCYICQLLTSSSFLYLFIYLFI